MKNGLRISAWALAFAACGSDSNGHLVDAPGNDSRVTDGASSPAAGIYVTNANNSVTIFARDASDDAAPVRTIPGSATTLALPIGIAIAPDGTTFVANREGSSVAVFAEGATGDVAPVRSLTSPTMGSPQGLALAATGDLYATACPNCGPANGGDTGIFHFAPGVTTTTDELTGQNDEIDNPDGLALDSAGELVVSNGFGGEVAIYAADATGTAMSTRSFTPSNATNVQSIAVGSASIAISDASAHIDLYAIDTSSGTPAASIDTSAQFPLQYPAGVFIDTLVDPEVMYVLDNVGNAIYVCTTTGTEPNLAIASVVTISGSDTLLDGPLGIAVVH